MLNVRFTDYACFIMTYNKKKNKKNHLSCVPVTFVLIQLFPTTHSTTRPHSFSTINTKDHGKSVEACVRNLLLIPPSQLLVYYFYYKGLRERILWGEIAFYIKIDEIHIHFFSNHTCQFHFK